MSYVLNSYLLTYLQAVRAFSRLKFYTVRIRNFAFLCRCDLDLDRMTFIYELNPYPLKTYPQTKKRTFYVNSFESYRITPKTRLRPGLGSVYLEPMERVCWLQMSFSPAWEANSASSNPLARSFEGLLRG